MSDLLKQLKLGSRAASMAGISIYIARTQQGVDVTAVCLEDPAEHRAAIVYENIVRFGAFGGLEIEQADSRALVASPSCAGTVAHLPTLGWRLSERLEVFKQVALIVENFHRAQLCAGPLDPAFILLDDELRPFMLGPEVVPSASPYAAPETSMTGHVDSRSDIYSLGRLLHFVLRQQEPPIVSDDPARLEDLITFPAGLSRIVRKAVLRNPAQRYSTVAAMLADIERYGRFDEVGVAHSEAAEQNFGGMSYRPPRPVEAPRPSTRRPLASPSTFKLESLRPFKLRQDVRGILLVAGALSVIGAFVVNYLAGDPNWMRVLLSLAAGLVGFSLFRPGMERESTVRGLFAAFFACATFMWNPTPYLAKVAEKAGLRSDSLETRVEAVQSLTERGVVEYPQVDLSGADLRGQMFHFAKLNNTSFEYADLSDARFNGATLDGARFRGAKLHGASFFASPVDYAIDFEHALCDAATALPEGWLCQGDHPTKERPKLSAQ